MRILKTGLLLFCSAIMCYAQKESLTIGPADMLHVKVLEAPELEQTARVTDNGTLPLIVGGNVKVVGLTPFEAAHAIEEALVAGHYLLTPHVSVTIQQPATQNVTVLGQVHAPGSYPIGTPRSVLEVLSLAGGLNDTADRKVTIQRHGTGEKTEYFLSNDSKAALDTAPLIYPGDTLIIPKADVVYMLGDFNRPGGYAITTNNSKITALQALTMAGGTPPNAVPSHARLIRKQADGTYTEMPLQLSAMQKGKQQDIPLQADDIVYVPFSYLRNIAVNVGGLIASASSAAIYRF